MKGNIIGLLSNWEWCLARGGWHLEWSTQFEWMRGGMQRVQQSQFNCSRVQRWFYYYDYYTVQLSVGESWFEAFQRNENKSVLCTPVSPVSTKTKTIVLQFYFFRRLCRLSPPQKISNFIFIFVSLRCVWGVNLPPLNYIHMFPRWRNDERIFAPHMRRTMCWHFSWLRTAPRIGRVSQLFIRRYWITDSGVRSFAPSLIYLFIDYLVLPIYLGSEMWCLNEILTWRDFWK